MELEGKVAIITGAGSGIGRASALLLSEKGAKIGALDHTTESLKEVVQDIENHHGQALPLVADISKPKEVQAAYKLLAEKWGRLDIVFANAGINGVWAPLEDLSPEEWSQTISVNLTGTFLTIKYAVPYLKIQGGSVIITSSVNGTRMFSNTGASAYASTKAAQVAFAKMVALELAKYQIRVNAICPGAIETNIEQNTEQRNLEKEREPVEYPAGAIPLTRGQSGKADDVAQVVLFLASDKSRLISGTEIWIDGAQSLLQG